MDDKEFLEICLRTVRVYVKEDGTMSAVWLSPVEDSEHGE